MNARAKPEIRFAAALVAALILAITAGVHGTPTPLHTVAPPSATAASTVVRLAPGRATVAPVTLPQISVRPTPAERAAALAEPLADQASPFLHLGDARGGGGSAASPRMNFDMPYYAFGKTLPRAASRE
jgi:hypothetical protein